jgi:integrase
MGVKVAERKDKPGTWWVFINHQGQRRKRGFGRDKKAAMSFAAKVAAGLKWAPVTGAPSPLSPPDHKKTPTVEEYGKDWLTTYADVHCKPSTAKGYRQMMELHIFPAFGSRPLHDITRTDIKRLVADLSARRLKRQTIHNILTPLKEAYQHAIDDGIVTANPVARTGRFARAREDRKAHIAPLTATEVQTFLESARERLPALYPLFLCAVRTGMREGELLALQWSDIDWRGRFIEVRRGIVRGQVSTTKTHKIRRVDMSPTLVSTLKTVHETRQMEAGMNGKAVSEWVFLAPGGDRMKDTTMRRAFYACMTSAGLRRVRFHDLRHTFASLLIQKGANPKYIQQQLGHGSIKVTMDVYGHLFEGDYGHMVSLLDEPLSEGKSAPLAHPPTVVDSRSVSQVTV